MVGRIIIGILSLLGILISGYFASIYHNLLPDVNRFVPRFCRMESGACSSLLSTSQARLFGVPNFDLGVLYYAGLLGSAVLPSLWKQLHSMLFFGSIVAIMTGFYLTYVLVLRLRVHCILCFTIHAVNFLIFLTLLAAP